MWRPSLGADAIGRHRSWSNGSAHECIGVNLVCYTRSRPRRDEGVMPWEGNRRHIYTIRERTDVVKARGINFARCVMETTKPRQSALGVTPSSDGSPAMPLRKPLPTPAT